MVVSHQTFAAQVHQVFLFFFKVVHKTKTYNNHHHSIKCNDQLARSCNHVALHLPKWQQSDSLTLFRGANNKINRRLIQIKNVLFAVSDENGDLKEKFFFLFLIAVNFWLSISVALALLPPSHHRPFLYFQCHLESTKPLGVKPDLAEERN